MKTILLTLTMTLVALTTAIGQTMPTDPNEQKLIGDKWLEIGIPALVVYFLVQALLTAVKNKGDNRLKQIMIERGVSEETIRELIRASAFNPALQALKWALLLGGVGVRFLLVYFLFSPPTLASLAGTLALSVASSFAVYYLILRNQTR